MNRLSTVPTALLACVGPACRPGLSVCRAANARTHACKIIWVAAEASSICHVPLPISGDRLPLHEPVAVDGIYPQSFRFQRLDQMLFLFSSFLLLSLLLYSTSPSSFDRITKQLHAAYIIIYFYTKVVVYYDQLTCY
jgi:hypothetical protein